jgi:hypothetical protein
MEGGSAYKEWMRSIHVLQINESFVLNSETIPNRISFLEYLPPWLGRKKPQPLPIIPIMNALKAAVEAYLETTIFEVSVAAPFLISQADQDLIINTGASTSLTKMYGIGFLVDMRL